MTARKPRCIESPSLPERALSDEELKAIFVAPERAVTSAHPPKYMRREIEAALKSTRHQDKDVLIDEQAIGSQIMGELLLSAQISRALDSSMPQERHKGHAGKERAEGKCPAAKHGLAPKDWKDITICFPESDKAFISVGRKGVMLTYGDLGFTDKRNAKPTRAWFTLMDFIKNSRHQSKGFLPCPPSQNPWDTTTGKQVKNINARLSEFFGFGNNAIEILKREQREKVPEYSGWLPKFFMSRENQKGRKGKTARENMPF